MDVAKKAVLVVMSALLAGCPRVIPITVHNHTGAGVDVVSDSGLVTIDADGRATLTDFKFDRDGVEVQALRLRSNFGESCHQLMFAGLGFSDEDIGAHEDSGTLLVVGPSGDVRLIRSTPETSLGSIPVNTSRVAPRLPRCEGREQS